MVFAFGKGVQERVEWRLAHIRMSLGCWRAKGSQKTIPDAMLDGLPTVILREPSMRVCSCRSRLPLFMTGSR